MIYEHKDKHIRNNLIIHELFHSKQEKLGFKNLSEANNGHLDTYKRRLLLRLELEALKKALQTENKVDLISLDYFHL